VATYDGMHTAGGSKGPSAPSHARGSRLFDDAGPAVFTLGFSALRARAAAVLANMLNTPTSAVKAEAPLTTPARLTPGTPSPADH